MNKRILLIRDLMEQTLILNLSIKLNMNLEDTRHHMKSIDKRLLNDEISLHDLSPLLRNCYNSWLTGSSILVKFELDAI